MSANYQSSVLVVDDMPANLEILTQMLKERGYRPRPVPSGSLAIRAAEHEPPDLILMDINMPELDGFETCRRLKEKHAEVPVLFISARSETMDKVQAFKAGGVDYITKPFDIEEVSARVETHLEISRLQRELQCKHEELQAMEELRDNLVHMVVHDMRSPLSVIQMALAILKQSMRDVIDEECALDLEAAIASSANLLVMVNNLLDLSKLESGKVPLSVKPCVFEEISQDVVKNMRTLADNVDVKLEMTTDHTVYSCDRGLIHRVMSNLLGNALKFQPEGTPVRVVSERDDNDLIWSVYDDGPGIAPEHQEKIFEKFEQVHGCDRKHASTGLGLTFCKLAIDAHGGRLGVDSTTGQGSRFWFRLPLGEAERVH